MCTFLYGGLPAMNGITHAHIFIWQLVRHTKVWVSVIPFIPSLNDQNQFSILKYMYIAPGQEVYSPWGQSFDVNRNFLSLRSSVASFKSETTIVSEKSIVLPFSLKKSIKDLAVK